MRQKTLTIIKYGALIALAIQAVHFSEHLAQLGYWFGHPTEAPWMTLWGREAMGWFAIGGNMKLGLELLHLVGNTIFLGGVLALLTWYRSRGLEAIDLTNIRRARTIQGWHLAEHVVLTVTVIGFGEAIGVSTLFGLVAGPVVFSTRVWFHFLINLAATWYAAQDLREHAPLITGRARYNRDRAPSHIPAPAGSHPSP